jgi:Carboxypeptidase regulatory-like domain
MNGKAWLSVALLLIATISFAQVSGIVKEDKTGKVLRGVQVFINRTTISFETNELGEFRLSGIDPGFFELVAFKEGYLIFRSPIRVQEGRVSKLNLKLVPDVDPPSEKPKHNSEWNKNLDDFKSSFLGSADKSTHCKILNPDAIVFNNMGQPEVGFRMPLRIDNLDLGYRISYYRVPAPVVFNNALSVGAVKFDTLTAAQPDQQKMWAANRERIFFGSLRHLMWSIANHRMREQGYELSNGADLLREDSLSQPSKIPGYHKILLPPDLDVTYSGEHRKAGVIKSHVQTKGPLEISPKGISLIQGDISVSGDMKESLPKMLPFNFFPSETLEKEDDAREIISDLQENVFLTTDKPYFYPGEVIWVKTDVTCILPELRDSLSRVLYVELITPLKTILERKVLRIDSGTSSCDFVLPDKLAKGNYYLRAYTNLMRNFGKENFRLKVIPVLEIHELIEPFAEIGKDSAAEDIYIRPNHKSYHPHDEIAIGFNIPEGISKTSSWSVSVTDAVQVVHLPKQEMKNDSWHKTPQPVIPNILQFPIEKGISFSGHIVNDKGKGTKMEFSFFKDHFENLTKRESDDQGHFWETGYDFYDSAMFSFQGLNSKGKPGGKITILKPDIAEMSFDISTDSMPVVEMNQPQRFISEYSLPQDDKVLKEVTITAQRLGKTEFQKRYGPPSRVFKGDMLVGTDLVTILRDQTFASVSVDAQGQRRISYVSKLAALSPKSIMNFAAPAPNFPEPLVYVNEDWRGGGLYGQPAADALTKIRVSDILRIEIYTRQDPAITMQGAFGIVSVFLKPGADMPRSRSIVTIPGYYKPRPFRSPDYSDSTQKSRDLRSTIYWNPSLAVDATGQAQVRFYAADVPTYYEIRLEGIDEQGNRLVAIKNIEIREK